MGVEEFLRHYPLKEWLLDQIKFHEKDKYGNIHCIPYYKECLRLLVESGQIRR